MTTEVLLEALSMLLPPGHEAPVLLRDHNRQDPILGLGVNAKLRPPGKSDPRIALAVDATVDGTLPDSHMAAVGQHGHDDQGGVVSLDRTRTGVARTPVLRVRAGFKGARAGVGHRRPRGNGEHHEENAEMYYWAHINSGRAISPVTR